MLKRRQRKPAAREYWTFMPARLEDASGIYDVRSTIWRETQEQYSVGASDIAQRILGPEEGVEREQAKIMARETVCEVAKVGGEVVAFCLASRGEELNQVDALYVLPRFRSRGLGGLLFKDVLTQLNDKDIVLNTHIDNQRGQAFYARFGFEPTGVVRDSVETGAIQFASGAVFPEVELVLSASPPNAER